MTTTREWAMARGVGTSDALPAVDDYDKPIPRTAEDVARRVIILHSVVARGYGVDPEPIVEWLSDELLWEYISPNERQLLTESDVPDERLSNARWRQEAQWALLWTINKVKSLGLPTATCDTSRLVHTIMPTLGDSTNQFVSFSKLRSSGELLAEDNRIYNLHCYARQAYRQNAMPSDLVYPVLFQRHYAFEWLIGDSEWDDVRTDT